MKKLKVVTVVGTRPEIIRLSRIISLLDTECDHKLIHTGQNYDYELNQIFFEDLELRKPDFFLNAAGSNSSQTIGKIIISFDEILEKTKPDAVLILGDTNSCLSVIAAKRRKIPIFHMEAGNRCFDMRVPEEINRKIVDHTSDINLTYSSISREYLINEGFPPDRIIKTGSPMFEVLNFYSEKIKQSKIIQKLKIKSNEYFLVSFHREENIDSENNLNKLINSLNKICEKYRKPIIVSTHPRTRIRIDNYDGPLDPLIRFLKPLSFSDYNNLQINSIAVLSDSGTISEESSISNFPAINLRETHERPEAMEETSVILSGLSSNRIINAIEILKNQKRGKDLRTLNLVKDYSNKNVSEKILRILISYTDYVKSVVWKELMY